MGLFDTSIQQTWSFPQCSQTEVNPYNRNTCKKNSDLICHGQQRHYIQTWYQARICCSWSRNRKWFVVMRYFWVDTINWSSFYFLVQQVKSRNHKKVLPGLKKNQHHIKLERRSPGWVSNIKHLHPGWRSFSRCP